jgi:putative RecB family exonuclease
MLVPDSPRHRHVSFTQLDTYLRCPLRYRFTYVDRLPPEFVPAARAFGSGIHGAVAFFLRGVRQGQPPSLRDLQGHFEGLWETETSTKPIRYGEKESNEGLLDLATKMLEVFHREQEPETEIVGVEEPFEVPLVNQETGELLEPSLVGSLDVLERSPEGRVVVVDIKTAARKYTDLQVEASLQLSIYSYAVAMTGLADEQDLRLRFGVLTKNKEPQLHRYWTTRDRAANLRLFRLVAEILHAIAAGAFHPVVGWHCQTCPYQSQCWAWGKTPTP